MLPSEFQAWLGMTVRRPLVMGVMNLTPDSFSNVGRTTDPNQAAELAEQMVQSGADWIDVGGESTRPGSSPVSAEEQIRRTAPAISAIRQRLNIIISIDTTDALVAERAVEAGANIINDISAGRDDPHMFPLAARHRLAIILMHMQGKPKTMQVAPVYGNVMSEVADFLKSRRDQAVESGIERGKILFDPGIGFGKDVSHNLQLLHDTRMLADLGQPLVVGASRKSFIGKITGGAGPDQRLFGTAAVVAWCVANGAGVVRVHDVGPISQVVRMIQAICVPKDAGFSKE
jgi:dihydropteroate synthase